RLPGSPEQSVYLPDGWPADAPADADVSTAGVPTKAGPVAQPTGREMPPTKRGLHRLWPAVRWGQFPPATGPAQPDRPEPPAIRSSDPSPAHRHPHSDGALRCPPPRRWHEYHLVSQTPFQTALTNAPPALPAHRAPAAPPGRTPSGASLLWTSS